MALDELEDNSNEDLSASLLVLATYSNFYSIVTVLACFIITVIFILRLNSDHHLAFSSSSVVVKHVISEQRMIGIQNPFSLQMDPSCTSSLSSGLHCLVSSLVPSSFHCYWGVDIDALYKEFQLPWKYLQKSIESDKFLAGCCIYQGVSLQLATCNERKFFLPTPQLMKESMMAATSRTRYPVVLMNLSLNNTYSSEGCVEVVASMSVIHLKDTSCRMNSCIINQHLKTCNNQMLNLQPLFVASSPAAKDIDNPKASPLKPSKSSNEPTSAGFQKQSQQQSTETILQNTRASPCSSGMESLPTNTEKNECIVCQCEQITMVLLPCRHACICSICFAKLERCPMCREFIYSYFRLEEGNPHEMSSPSTTIPPLSNVSGQSTSFTSGRTFRQWIVQLNSSINNYLGFR